MFSGCVMAICKLTLSVMIMSTQLLPVNGRLQLSTILLFPFYKIKNKQEKKNKQDMTWVG